MTRLSGRSLLDIPDLTKDDITFLFSKTKEVKKRLKDSDQGLSANKTVALLFFEPSTRTRSSFEMAAHRLGLRTLNLESGGSSLSKGESVIDTARNIEALAPSALVIRHSGSGAPYKISKVVKVPVINAGDGFHAHPTQALLDVFTIQEKFGSDISGLNVLVVGDIAHSRVTRSNIQLLKMFGAKVHVCAPPTLIPPLAEEWGVKVHDNIDKALPLADVVMLLRMQTERQNSFQVPSLKEYTTRFGITADRLKLIKQKAIIMHPGPVNRGVELMSVVLRDPRSCVMEQVHNGMLIRMVLLAEVLGIQL